MIRSIHLALAAGAATFAVAAPTWATDDALVGSRYATLGAEFDDDDSNLLTSAIGLPLGEHGRMDFGLGRSRTTLDETRTDSTFASIDAGLDTDRVEFQIGYAYRKDSDEFRQQDLSGSLTLVAARGKVGIDLFYRDAEDETTASIERRRREPRSIRTVESISGSGAGLHGSFNVSDDVRLFASGMIYDYDRDVDVPAALLARFPRLSLRVSGVTRDEAFLDNTARVGVDYSFDAITLTVFYIRDEELDTHDLTDTGEVSADIPLGDRWLLTPWVGYSSGETDGATGFAGVTVSVMW